MAVTNPLRGESRLDLVEEGKAVSLLLVWDVAAFCIAEEEMGGRTTDEMLEDIRQGRIGLRLTRALLHGALQHHHPCHLVRTEEIMSNAGGGACKRAMLDGLIAAFGKKKDEEGKEEPDPQKEPGDAGTG